ncbi:MAG TPA: GNAT family N-acetyltransferase [Pseudonocardiaceae bacterium]|jgi:GNAT superfamily N-acetyltransferase|nr:GNAT family N-acetyltransferase [Pseudonocardiaceae bacterium]
MATVIDLDALMRQGWPAQIEVPVDGWIARLSGGVTQRANSVLPLAAPVDLVDTIERVERLYREHGIAPTFQVGPTAQPDGLDEVLAERGYQPRTPVSVQTAAVEDVLREIATLAPAPSVGGGVQISEEPSQSWLDFWWTVDGRGDEARAKEVARHILTAGPALYAARYDQSGVTAIGRLALVGDWAGLYCLAVRPDCRRQGQAIAIISALLDEARARGVRYTWLQVMIANVGARALYARLGFRTAADYHYRTLVGDGAE